MAEGNEIQEIQEVKEEDFSIAVPTLGQVAMDGEGNERKVAYIINSTRVGEPFLVLFSHNAWWMEPGMVQKLMTAFHHKMKIVMACVYVGIPVRSYYYFVKIHPHFLNVKQACEQGYGIKARATLEKGLEADPNLAHRYLLHAEKEVFDPPALLEVPEGGSYAKLTEEAFADKDGNLVMSRQTAELLEHYGTDNETKHTTEQEKSG